MSTDGPTMAVNLAEDSEVLAATMATFGVTVEEATRMLGEFSLALQCNGDCKHHKRTGPFWAQPVPQGRMRLPRIVIHTCEEP